MPAFTFRRPWVAAGATLVLLTAGAALVPQAAYAGYNIYSPHVELGETEIEARGYFNQDNLPGVDGTGSFK
ncbi:MAG TPA: hypothetical protein VFK24_02220, partial [Gammaproteobacteria bacterium]|nr:hypothetical protein [Gammaproteobacteria bacterium]